jgi:G:T-mismatch repair DNA endonuclease (very short patch repair protein)
MDKRNQPHSKEHIKKIVETRRKNNSYIKSKETRNKISLTLTGRWAGNKNYFYGKHLIPWNKGKKCPSISEKNKGRKHTKEEKIKMSLSHKGKPLSETNKNNIRLALLGRKILWKDKISLATKGNHNSPKTEITKESRKYLILPKKDTSIEIKVQNYLKKLGITFFTHQYINEIEHGYQCDILIPTMNLVIECDGDYWHNYPIGREIDNIRTSELINKGFKVLRLWECEINKMTIDEFNNRLNS